ncbi:bifunctional protein GlmU-like [Artemia franciscana]|uniref:bifunctional protein GlmU-like n=1 Tax=Artemia franciscana TaxID=6661 RepID=UPI0032DA2087
MKVFAVRFEPGENLSQKLKEFVKENGLKSAFVLTCVGSLTRATLRLATNSEGENKVITLSEKLEIVSLVGTLSGGEGHLHISLGRADGTTISGHVFGDLDVYTTAEVVIGEIDDLIFNRKFDENTGFPELVVSNRFYGQ